MVFWLQFDETTGATAYDIASGYDGVTQDMSLGGAGSPASVRGKVANAFEFSGGPDRVSVTDVPGILSFGNPTDNFTIDAWIKVNSGDASGVQQIVDKRIQTGSRVTGYTLYIYNGNLGFQMADGSVENAICSASTDPSISSCTNYGSTTHIADGTWHHIAVTVQRTPSPTVTFYDNGIAVYTGTARTGNANNNAPLLIGKNSLSSSGYFKGAIDELQLFNRALSGLEIAAISTAGSAGMSTVGVIHNAALAYLAAHNPVPFDLTVSPHHRLTLAEYDSIINTTKDFLTGRGYDLAMVNTIANLIRQNHIDLNMFYVDSGVTYVGAPVVSDEYIPYTVDRLVSQGKMTLAMAVQLKAINKMSIDGAEPLAILGYVTNNFVNLPWPTASEKDQASIFANVYIKSYEYWDPDQRPSLKINWSSIWQLSAAAAVGAILPCVTATGVSLPVSAACVGMTGAITDFTAFFTELAKPSEAVLFAALPHSASTKTGLDINDRNVIVYDKYLTVPGEHGVSVALNRADSFQANWLNLNPYGTVPDGAYLNISATGNVGGVSNQPLGFMRITDAGAQLELTVDSSPVGSATQTIVVYNGSDVVATISGHSGVAAQFITWPDGIRWCAPGDHRCLPPPCPPQLPCQPCPYLWCDDSGAVLTWNLSAVVNIPGWGEVTGDRIIISPENATQTLGILSSVNLAMSQIPSMTITNESASYSPDLIVSALSTAVSSVGSGGRLTLSDAVKNQGGIEMTAIPTYVNYYLSTDATITSADTYIGNRNINTALVSGASSTASLTVTVPPSLPPRTYYLGAIADATNAQIENNETNNERAGGVITVLPAVDLLMTAVSKTAASLNAGQTFAISSNERNQATAAMTASNNTVGFYLSTDNIITTADIRLTGSRVVSALAAGAYSGAASTTVTVPLTVPTRVYFVGACADVSNAQVESNETNNCKVAAGTLTVGRNVDLIMSVVSKTATSVGAGRTFAITSAEKNRGTTHMTAASNTVKFYLSLDNIITTSDILLTGSRVIPRLLAAQSSSTLITTVTVPTTVAPRVGYYVGACADVPSVQVETIETNNCKVALGTINVVRDVDLMMSAVSTTATSVAVGGSFPISNTEKNQGAAAMLTGTTSVIKFYLSTDAIITSADILLTGTRTVTALAAGAISAASTMVVVPATVLPRVYYIGAIADGANQLLESVENNNARAGGTITIN